MFRLSRLPWFASLVLAFGVLIGCHDVPTQPRELPPIATGKLFLYAQSNVISSGTLVVQVSGPGIVKSDGSTPDTLAFNIAMANGVASGSITLPAGPQRKITVRMFDGLNETHRGSVTIDIAEGVNPTVSITLVPLVGDVPINVTIGTTIVIVRPLIGTLAVGDTLRLTAEIRDMDGNLVNGRVRWATLNPGRASVDTLGLVTMRDTGEVQIVATYGTVGGASKLTGTLAASAVSYHLTWNGSVSSNWNTAANWTPHGIGVQRVPTISDSVSIAPGTPNQPQVECNGSTGDVPVRDLVVEVGATLGTGCGYGVQVYGRAVVRGTMSARLYARPGARLSGGFANLYILGDTVSLADTVRASYLEVNASNANLRLAGHRLRVNGDINIYNGTVSLSDPDTLIASGNINWSGSDHTGKITGGVVLFRGSEFNGYRYKASGTNRLVFDRAVAGQQSISGFYYFYNDYGSLQRWDIRNVDGVRICSHVSVSDSITITSTGTPLVVDNTNCGGYYVRALGKVITGANTTVSSYLWELHDTTGTSLVTGAWNPGYTDFYRSGATIKAGLAYQNLRIYSASVRFAGPTTVTGVLHVEGSGAELALNGQKVTVGDVLEIYNNALLTMNNPADSLLIAKSASFNSSTYASQGAKLTAGLLTVGGGFYGYGFAATGTHTVKFVGGGSNSLVINGMNRDYYGGQGFQNLEIGGASTYLMNCDNSVVRGTFTLRAGSTFTTTYPCGESGLRVMGDLVTEAGSTLSVWVMKIANASGTSKVAGAWAPGYTDFEAVDAPVKAGLAYNTLRFYGSNRLLGATQAAGEVHVGGTGVDLNLNGQSLAVGSYFIVENNATLTMQNAADSLEVARYASFNSNTSAQETSRLTAGVMRVGGYFYGYGFDASGAHRVVMTGTSVEDANAADRGRYIQGMNYDYRNGQGFQNLEFAGTATYGIQDQVRAKGVLRVGSGVTVRDRYYGTLRVDGDLITAPTSAITNVDYTMTVALFNPTGTQNVNGGFSPGQTNIYTAPAGGQLKPGLGYTNVGLYAAITLPDSLTINGELYMYGPASNLTLNGKRLAVKGRFNMDNNAVLTMTNANDSLIVEGWLDMDSGASEAGKLTAGTVIMKGDRFCAPNYFATGTHKTVLQRTVGTETVSVQCIGNFASQQLRHLEVRGNGISLYCNLMASGDVLVATGAKVEEVCGSGTFQVGGTLTTQTGTAITNGPAYPGNHSLSVVMTDSAGTSGVSGSFDPNWTYFLGLHARIKPNLGYRYTRIDKSTSFLGRTVIDGQLDIINDGTIVTMAGNTVEVKGTLNFDNQSKLVMDQATDSLLIATNDPAADVYWDGADQTGSITNGVIKFYGDRFYAPRFAASGQNRFVFASNASGGAISVEGSCGSPCYPTFNKLDMAGTRAVNINGRAVVGDTLNISAPALLTGTDYLVVGGGGALVTAAGSDINIPNLYLDGPTGTRAVLGRFRPGGVHFRSPTSTTDAIKPGLEYNYVDIQGPYELSANTSFAGSLDISQAVGELKLAGRKLTVGGYVAMSAGGNLRMMDIPMFDGPGNRDTLVVGDYFRVYSNAGPSTLSAGVMYVGGNVQFEHDGVNASGTHKVILNGTGTATQYLYLNSNGNRRLQNVEVRGTRPLQLYYGGTINGNFDVQSPVVVNSGNYTHIGGELTSVASSSLNFTNVLELAGAGGTAGILGNYSNSYITRFTTGSQSIQMRSGISYSSIEVDGTASVVGGPLVVSGDLRVRNSVASLTVPDASTVGGNVDNYGTIDFNGGAVTTGDLYVRVGGRANAKSSTANVDFRSIYVYSGTPNGILDNTVASSAPASGFRRKTTGQFYNPGGASGLYGPAPLTY